MRVAVFSTSTHDEAPFSEANSRYGHALTFLRSPLNSETAPIAKGFPCVCVSAGDEADARVIQTLVSGGTRLLALRTPEVSRVDLEAAWGGGIVVVRTPGYSPHSIAEHTLALVLALSRRIPRACERVKDGNPSQEGLVGFDLNEKTVGIIGTGSIGRAVARMFEGFGCNVLGCDLIPNLLFEAHGAYVAFDELLAQSDIVTLHCPLTADTRHMIGRKAIKEMKDGVMLVNTSHGALLSPTAILEGLKSGRIGYLGLDLYEEEDEFHGVERATATTFQDVMPKLMSFSNVIVTSHQGYLSQASLAYLAAATLENITEFERTGRCHNAVMRAISDYSPRLHAAG
ncbi:MAG: 2-hydroxyacid dehydrogenase [Candidatus Hydrogenedentes bacterium]|nr:2-hydroxyacid dehydrogenase [Candidatus Hydrogenedentota bacterium]